MVLKRTMVGRSQGSPHNKHARGHARGYTQRRGFVRNHGGPHDDRSSGVTCAHSTGRDGDAGFAACGVLTSGRAATRVGVKDGGHFHQQGQVRGSRTSCSGQGTSNHRLKLPARGRSAAAWSPCSRAAA